ncbi:MAG TPA: tRNA lysidine(34) synthetase TilS [Acidimicrobiales bacterium]|nr:tRNA lysidine(34) synthetase TilS [Acidimicrobiales bacterium]
MSGGADSLALLVLAAAAGLEVTAVHVDHGLRPGGPAEAEAVAQAARLVGAGFRSVRVHVAPGGDLEARARAARYAALPAGVMTGHTADDLAETVVINLLRGAGLGGLAPMRAEPGRPQRPLLGLRRADTEAVCSRCGLVPLADPMNADPRFVRARVRTEVLPLLADVAGRDVVAVLARQAALIGDDAALLDELAAGIDPTDARMLATAPAPLARRAVRRWLRATGDDEAHPPSAAEVARVLGVAAGRAVACQVSGGRRVARRAGRLRIEGGELGPGGGR